ncbi:MAG: sortase [Dehalococcoidia bacterium]|nr:sortase [Dehalococcoidia bacterium]
MGFNPQGQLEVPWTSYDVGWYSVSARPGSAGNALMGGHLNWAGELGVFDRLSELSAGDLIYVDTVDGRVTYEVERTHYIAYDSTFAELLGVRSGRETLTLFTCGGTFDQSRREYDERFVVRAVMVDAG